MSRIHMAAVSTENHRLSVGTLVFLVTRQSLTSGRKRVLRGVRVAIAHGGSNTGGPLHCEGGGSVRVQRWDPSTFNVGLKSSFENTPSNDSLNDLEQPSPTRIHWQSSVVPAYLVSCRR